MTPEEMDRRKAIIKRIAEQTAKEWFMDEHTPDVDLDSYIHDAIYKAIKEIFGETV